MRVAWGASPQACRRFYSGAAPVREMALAAGVPEIRLEENPIPDCLVVRAAERQYPWPPDALTLCRYDRQRGR